MDEYLSLFPELHSRALETLWKLDYDLDMAREAMIALAGDAAQGIHDPAEPLHLDRLIPTFSEETRARFLEGMALHGEEWAKVKAYMGDSHSIGNLQDYFYGVMCTASHAPLRADVQRRYKAMMRAKEAAERREKERRLKEEAKVKAAEAKEREEREKEEREREEKEREQLRSEDPSAFLVDSSDASAVETREGAVGMDLESVDECPQPPPLLEPRNEQNVQNGALMNGHECTGGEMDGATGVGGGVGNGYLHTASTLDSHQ